MLNVSYKSVAFVLGAIMSVLSWIVIFFNIVLRIVSLNSLGVYSIDIVGFIFTTIVVSAYTMFILFKISSTAYFPIILILLHIATLNGSSLAIIFIIVDLIMLFLLNSTPKPLSEQSGKRKKQTYYYKNSAQYNANDKTETNKKTATKKANDDDIFEAEYKTK